MRIGPYEVLETIGRGGMGVVYRVRTPSGEVAALKVLARTQQESVARFEREQRLLRSFTAQDGFVPLLDAGATPGGPYLVMPFVPGGTLREKLARGPIGIEATLDLGRTLAGALGRAHARGIVHRDLKPENVLFDASGEPLVADLGLAKHFDRLASGASQSVSLSRDGTSRGTAGYMPPEQLENAKSVGPPADVFALGAILYECLAGKPVFTGDSTLAVVQNVAAGKFDRLDRKEAPPWLAAVVERALAVKAADRFQDGSALERALAEPARGRSRLLPVVVALAALSLAGALVMTRHAEAPPAVVPVVNLPPGLREGAKAGEHPVYLWKLPGDLGDLELVRVPAGDFVMGSDTDEEALEDEKPRHRHRLDRAYWIGRNPVTWGQYLAFCKATGREEPEEPSWWDKVPGAKLAHPVVMVSWVDAKAYCAWAGLVLPTEAEWERAARGTDGRKYPWGSDWDPGVRCNFADGSCPLDTIDMGWQRASEIFKAEGWEWDRKHQDGYPYTSPVGSFPRGESPVGALDMAGNVYQFCEDWYEPRAYDRYAKGDTASPASGSDRIGRGGAWVFPASHCRSASRGKITPNLHAGYLGFRVVLRAGS